MVKRIIGRNRWEENDDGGDDEEEPAGKKKGKSRKGRKGKGKQAQAPGEEDGEQGDEQKQGDAMDVDPKEESAKPQPRKILAVRRIESVTLDAAKRIMFSTIGYAFLHLCSVSLPSTYKHLLPRNPALLASPSIVGLVLQPVSPFVYLRPQAKARLI